MKIGKKHFHNSVVLFLECCPDCAVVIDRQCLIVYANPAFRGKFCGAKDAQGSNFLSYLDNASLDRFRQLQPQLLQGVRQVELNHQTPDSKITPLFYSFFPLSSSSLASALIAGIGRDRTADLGTLLEIIRLNIELERKQKELAEANERAWQLAETDQVTELYNRHYFFSAAEKLWEESRQHRLPMVVMMIDIDDFKAVNDSHGHIFGDYVLQQMSFSLRNIARKSDILARYGGEELVLIAPQTDLLTGLALAESFRSAVVAEPFVMENCSARITISVGVSGTELGDFASFEALLRSSDSALYEAKHNGKNCVWSFAALKAPNIYGLSPS